MGLDFNAFQMGQGAVGDPTSDILNRQLAQLQMQGQALQNRAAMSQLQMQQIQLQRQQTFGQDMQGFLQNPSASGVAALFGKYPEFATQITNSWNTLDTVQRRTDATQLGSVASLVAKGDYDNAAKIVQTRIDADRQAGRDTSADQQALSMLQSGDPKQQKAVLGLATIEAAGAVGPDKAADYLKALGLSEAPEKLGPGDKLANPLTGDTIASNAPLLQHVEVKNVDGSQTATTFNPQTGAFGGAAVSGTPAEGGGPTSSGGAASGPRSVRNNNPGNLKATGFTKSQPGFAGVDDAGYAIFDSPQDGLNAQTALLQGSGYYGGGRKTVAAIVSKWAPPKSAGGDNTNAQTANYISYVSKQLGVKPGDVLSPQQLPQVAQAMAAFEAGATGHAGIVRVPAAPAPAQGGASASAAAAVGSSPYTFGGSSGGVNNKGAPPGYVWNADHTGVVPLKGGDQDPNSYAPEMLDDAAKQFIVTGQMPSMGMGGAAMKKAILTRRSQIMQQLGITAADLPALQSRYAADKLSLGQNTQLLSGLNSSEGALVANAKQVIATQRALLPPSADNPNGLDIIDNGSPILNRTRIATYKQVGSAQTKAAIKAYEDAVNAYSVEYAKFMSSASGMSNAPSSDSARSQANDLNDSGMGPAALQSHLRQSLIEAQNKKGAVAAQNQALQQRLASYLQPRQSQRTPPAGASATATGPGGKKIALVNGRWVPY